MDPAGVAPGATWRLLVTEAADGATNMAIDEVLWRGRRAATAPPTLRFYAWAPPTVSLGYGQALDAEVDHAVCGALGIGIVRRPTGGSAIYHDGPERELTYSVAATNDDLGVGTDLLASYRWIARALARGLAALGARVEIVERRREYGPVPAFCFARTGTYELELDGRKLVGSAQRRHGRSFLQHGSIVLGLDAARVRAIFPATADPAASVATLEQALGHRPAWDACAEALGAAFEAEHGIVLRPGGLTVQEADEVARLARDKYATEAWLAGRA
ncbi:MAG TPA: biotin/lipoate A/B protein ligase family protein [Terriglobales bacterium]|nr:biotin/lipoate A/B protein ligase family protein [Terriglobales bacterium]